MQLALLRDCETMYELDGDALDVHQALGTFQVQEEHRLSKVTPEDTKFFFLETGADLKRRFAALATLQSHHHHQVIGLYRP